MSISVAWWGISWAIMAPIKEEIPALFWTRMLNFGAIFIPIFFLHWILSLLEVEKEKNNKIVLFIGYLLTFLFALFAFSPYFLIVKLKPHFFYYPDPGILHPFYLIFGYFGLVGYGIYNLFKSYKKASDCKKAQIKYVLMGSALGFGGGATNYFLFYNIPIPPFGNPLVAVGFGILAYAVIVHRLMDIKIVVSRFLIFAIWIFVLIRTFLSTSYQELIINLSLLAITVIVGIMLIRSVSKEIKQKNVLEKLNEDLKKAYETEKEDKLKIKRMGEKLLETERKIKDDIQEAAGQTAKRFHNYFMRDENLDKLKLKQEILMLTSRVKELEKELEKKKNSTKKQIEV